MTVYLYIYIYISLSVRKEQIYLFKECSTVLVLIVCKMFVARSVSPFSALARRGGVLPARSAWGASPPRATAPETGLGLGWFFDGVCVAVWLMTFDIFS